MAKTNLNNGKAIDDYITAEQAELTNLSGQPGISAIASALSVIVNIEQRAYRSRQVHYTFQPS